MYNEPYPAEVLGQHWELLISIEDESPEKSSTFSKSLARPAAKNRTLESDLQIQSIPTAKYLERQELEDSSSLHSGVMTPETRSPNNGRRV